MAIYRKAVLIVVVAIGILMVFVLYKRDLVLALLVKGPDIGASAPEFTLIDKGDDIVRLSHYKDKTVILHFMASWCGDCLKELPEIQAIYNKKKSDLNFIFINVAFREDRNDAKKLFREKGYDMPIYNDPKGETALRYGIRGIPASIVIDANGRIEAKLFGAGRLKEAL